MALVETPDVFRFPLSHGRSFLIDGADLPLIAQHRWCLSGRQRHYYVMCEIEPGRSVYLHRFLMSPPDDLCVDHANRDTLDNRRANLRICTPDQNRVNSLVTNRRKTSLFKGVHRAGISWVATIRVNRKGHYLGSFHNEEDAARAYDAAATRHHGAFARINFGDVAA